MPSIILTTQQYYNIILRTLNISEAKTQKKIYWLQVKDKMRISILWGLITLKRDKEHLFSSTRVVKLALLFVLFVLGSVFD